MTTGGSDQRKTRKLKGLKEELMIWNIYKNTRMDDLVISGLETTHRTYARITAGDKKDEDAPRGELHALEQQVIEFFNNKDIPIDSKNIAACYTIPQKRNNKPSIII